MSASSEAGVSGGDSWGSALDPKLVAGEELLDHTMMRARKGGPGTIIWSTKLNAAL